MGDHQLCDGIISSLLQDARQQRVVIQELQKQIAELQKQLAAQPKGN